MEWVKTKLHGYKRHIYKDGTWVEQKDNENNYVYWGDIDRSGILYLYHNYIHGLKGKTDEFGNLIYNNNYGYLQKKIVIPKQVSFAPEQKIREQWSCNIYSYDKTQQNWYINKTLEKNNAIEELYFEDKEIEVICRILSHSIDYLKIPSFKRIRLPNSDLFIDYLGIVGNPDIFFQITLPPTEIDLYTSSIYYINTLNIIKKNNGEITTNQIMLSSANSGFPSIGWAEGERIINIDLTKAEVEQYFKDKGYYKEQVNMWKNLFTDRFDGANIEATFHGNFTVNYGVPLSND